MSAQGAGQVVGAHPIRVNRPVRQGINMASGITQLPVFSPNFENTPGLGFDYPHLAAVNQGRVPRNFFGGGEPFGFSGFLLSSPSVIVEEVPVEQQPVAEQGAANRNEAADNGRDLASQFLPEPATTPVPPRETAEYVFVKRDGGLLFAIAYSWDDGILRYVTRDGVRRSVSRDSLDMDATQQFNEQRGLSFRLPA
jgi:hypothetical protein